MAEWELTPPRGGKSKEGAILTFSQPSGEGGVLFFHAQAGRDLSPRVGADTDPGVGGRFLDPLGPIVIRFTIRNMRSFLSYPMPYVIHTP